MKISNVDESGIELRFVPENTVFRTVGRDEDNCTYLKIIQSTHCRCKTELNTISALCLDTGELIDDFDDSVQVRIYPNAVLELKNAVTQRDK